MSPLMFIQRPFRWLNAISAHQATISGGPNFAYDLCIRKITSEQKQQLDLSSWELAFNGAEPINHQTLAQFSEAFAPCGFKSQAFYPCYGMAETTLIATGGKKHKHPVTKIVQSQALGHNQIISLDHTSQEGRTIVGCGHSLPDQHLIIVNPETLKPCADNEVGEIWVQGPSVASGYWKQKELTASSFQGYLASQGLEPNLPSAVTPTPSNASSQNLVSQARQGGPLSPFLRTGDLGFLDDGELYFTGRLKDVMIIHGANHYPQDVEWTIEQEQHPCFRPGCIAAFSVEHAGQEQVIILAEVERRYVNPEKYADSLEAIIGSLRRRIWQRHQLQIHQFILIRTGTLPKTSSGKIQRHQCRESYLSGEMATIKIA